MYYEDKSLVDLCLLYCNYTKMLKNIIAINKKLKNNTCDYSFGITELNTFSRGFTVFLFDNNKETGIDFNIMLSPKTNEIQIYHQNNIFSNAIQYELKKFFRKKRLIFDETIPQIRNNIIKILQKERLENIVDNF